RLRIAIEQDAVDLALPGIELAHGGKELVRIPVWMLGIGNELVDRHDIGRLRHEEIAIVPGAGHEGVVLPEPARKIGAALRLPSTAADSPSCAPKTMNWRRPILPRR